MEKTCKRCGKGYGSNHNGSKYCPECLKLGKDVLSGKVFDYTKPQVCGHCSEEFYYGRKRKYCSNDCCKEAMLQNAKVECKQAERKTYKKVCLECGAEFTAENTRQAQCSDECVNYAARR
jgi:uncharacterized Zn ribbon protein